MRDIVSTLENVFNPVKALLIYRSATDESETYIESYDINSSGRPVNAHPLALEESIALAKALDSSDELNRDYMKSSGIMPKQVLYIDPSVDGHVVWRTNQKDVNLLFSESLGIPCGTANVPALIWKATKEQLYVYAVKDLNPSEKTRLYNAPFFNIYKDGLVCMGTVNIEISGVKCLEDFISTWESYFWNSYFSHSIEAVRTARGNIIQLWKDQVENKSEFPAKVLISMGKTLNEIL